MSTLETISTPHLALGYLMLLVPLGIMLYTGLPLLRRTGIAALRMTVQLLFVGFYLQVVFERNHPGLNLLWMLVMILVADASILSSCQLRLRTFALPLFVAILAGTALPALFFTRLLLRLDDPLTAQYFIPVGGMILGNCLRADIIGLHSFYTALRERETRYHTRLAHGATAREALAPFTREALRAALAPTLATMSTIGLVSLPGMMTGVILAGANPMHAIHYQIAIMIAIFSGTSLTVFLGITLSRRHALDAYGLLRPGLFRTDKLT